jgi:hypothetical protein
MSLKIVLCGFLSLLLPSLGVAREWSDSSGKFKVEAELISYGDGKVILKKANGQPVTVPLEKLSTKIASSREPSTAKSSCAIFSCGSKRLSAKSAPRKRLSREPASGIRRFPHFLTTSEINR